MFEIIDSAGTVVPDADQVVRVTTEGGTIVALDNADLQDHDPYQSDRRRVFNGRGLAVLRAVRPGRLHLKAEADGLPPATVSVTVIPGDVAAAVPAAR
jgi:beta-galactosidase